MMEEIEVQMVVVAHHDKVWRNIHKAMTHTKKINEYFFIIYLYPNLERHTCDESLVMAKWISALSFGLSFDADNTFSS